MHFLNLDIVAGVAATGLLAERATGASFPGEHLPWSWWIVVPLAAWVVYTVDRLVDVQLAPAEHPTLRHQFHARHRLALIVACGVIVIGVAVLALLTFTPAMLLAAPICAAVIVTHHLLQRVTRRHSRRPFHGTLKDLNVVLVYTFATWYIPILVGIFTVDSATVLASFMLIVTAMVLQLSVSDAQSDTALRVSSSALELGTERAALIMRLCCAAAAAFAFIPMPDDAPLIAILVLMSVCTAMLPLVFAHMQRPHARLTTELILSLPYFLIVFPRM